MNNENTEVASLRYAADESPSHLLSLGLGFQTVLLIVAGIIITPTIVMRAAGQGAATTQWAIFASLIVCGITTMIQARPIGRFGAGYVLFMGTSGAFIAISIDAIKAGGLPLMATLVVVAAIIQFIFSYYLAQLRKIITPAVGGTVIMLIAVIIMPIAFDLINSPLPNLSKDTPIAPISAFITFAVTLLISIFFSGFLSLWGPAIGIIAGVFFASLYGGVDASQFYSVSWIGLPDAHWPGFDLNFDINFWSLLLPFVIVTLVGAIETFGDCVAIQRLSHRKKRAIDFRKIQGGVNADGLGNLLSGILGTLPNTTYSTSLSTVNLTRVASSKVGLFGGGILLLLAFSPKFSALLLAIPNPIVGAYVFLLIVFLFVHGFSLIASEGLDNETGLILGLSFWLAVGFQGKDIFYDFLPKWSLSILGDGMVAGTVISVLLTLLLKRKKKNNKYLQVPGDIGNLPKIKQFLAKGLASYGWDEKAMVRVELAVEESLIYLLGLRTDKNSSSSVKKNIRVSMEQHEGAAEIEFITGNLNVDNVEDATSELTNEIVLAEEEINLKLLNSIVEEYSHKQFRNLDILKIKILSRPL